MIGNFITKIKKIHLTFIMLLLILLISTATYFLFKKTSKNLPDIKIVEVSPVELKKLKQTIGLIGFIKPKHMTTLKAKVSGSLDMIETIETSGEGKKIPKGTLLAKIDNPDIEKNYELSESAEKIAKSQYERVMGLLKSGYVSRHEVDEKKRLWIEAQKTLAQAKIDLDKSRFYAPFDGITGVFKVREGAYVKEGETIVNFYDPTALTVTFDIPEHVIHLIDNNQPVRINGIQFKISHLQRMLDEDSHMCPANVDIDCEKCVIGSAVDVDLTVQEKKQALVIPFNSIFLRQGKTFVYVVENHKAILKPVKLGVREKEEVEITSGLKANELVILKGQARLFPDAPVKIYSPSHKAGAS